MKIKLTTLINTSVVYFIMVILIIPMEANGKTLNKVLSKPFSFERNSLEINYSANTPDITMIPVAFHIIKKSDGTGEVTDEQIYLQIDVLNYAFSVTN